MAKGKVVFYAIARGRIPGVYNSWRVAKKQVDGYSGHLMNSFTTHQEAQEWIERQWRPKDGAATERWKIMNIAPVLHPLQIAAMNAASSSRQNATHKLGPTQKREERELTDEEIEFREMQEDQQADREDIEWVHELCFEPLEVAVAKGDAILKGNRAMRRAAEKAQKLKDERMAKKMKEKLEFLARKKAKRDEALQRAREEKQEWRKQKKDLEEALEMGRQAEEAEKRGEPVAKFGEPVIRRTGKPAEERPLPRLRELIAERTHAAGGPLQIRKVYADEKLSEKKNQKEEPETITSEERAPLRISKHYGWSPLAGMHHNEFGVPTSHTSISP